MSIKKPHSVDIHVGSRVRLRRTLLGISQDKLGKALGLTFQQIQKYEKGANRMGSSRLWQISQTLDVPISFFFDDMPEGIEGGTTSSEGYPPEVFTKRSILGFMKDFVKMNDDQKKAVHNIVKVIGAKENE